MGRCLNSYDAIPFYSSCTEYKNKNLIFFTTSISTKNCIIKALRRPKPEKPFLFNSTRNRKKPFKCTQFFLLFGHSNNSNNKFIITNSWRSLFHFKNRHDVQIDGELREGTRILSEKLRYAKDDLPQQLILGRVSREHRRHARVPKRLYEIILLLFQMHRYSAPIAARQQQSSAHSKTSNRENLEFFNF